jgi:diguanylate cyclase (GGDEF)-like protein
MDDLLQRSRTFEEAFGIIRKACLKFFPGTTGLLLLLSNSRNMSELVLSWGEGRTGCNPEQCTIENCWALRRGQIHVVGNLGLGHSCAGGEIAETDNYACAPLVAQGLALGVLSLRQEGRSFEQKDQEWVVTVSRHIAPALANLQLNRTLHMQSVRDPLTGLYNRRYLQETLERELHRAKRKNTPIGVIMLDIDHFKRFNDDYGHEAGDAVLQEVSGLLQKWTRVEDIACRFGGEEFVVVMPEAGLETCGKRAEILREQIERLKIAYRGELLRTITSSLGVAVYPDNGATMEDVLTAADAALYRSKASGRNRVSLCDRAPA